MTTTEPLRGPALLLALLSYTREGSPPPTLVEPSPGPWGTWAAGMYASMIRLQVPPTEYANGAQEWKGGRMVRPLVQLWTRQTSLLRKVRAYQLWQLANERVPMLPDGRPDPDSPWFPSAQRWADCYFRLPGGDIPDTPGVRAELEDLRILERIHLLQGPRRPS